MLLLRYMHILASWIHVLGSIILASIVLAAAGGGAVNARLDVLTHFAVIYLFMAVVALVTCPLLTRRARAASICAACLSISGCALLVGPELLAALSQRPARADGASLKVIQFNAFGERDDLARSLDWLIAQDADVIVLEEPGGLEMQLGKLKGYYANYGNMGGIILTRTTPIETNAPDWSKLWKVPPEKRPPVELYSYSRVHDGFGDYAIFGVHRPWPMNVASVAKEEAGLRDAVARAGAESSIVAGDFNSTPWSFDRRREDRALGLSRRTRALFSWPAARISHNRWPIPAPLLPIDHVYAGSDWLTTKVERGPNLGSDHYPVIVTLVRVKWTGHRG